MDPVALQDAISRGMGVAALKLGALCDAYRPRSAQNPLGPANRYLRLAASFNAEDPSYRKPSGYGRATWFGVFDSAYTQPGDYLSGPPGVFFIAAQQPLLPVLCVLTNRTLSAIRPAAPSSPGVNTYGGLNAANATPLLTAWPASILAIGGGQSTDVTLPGDTKIPFWSVLLPTTPVTLRASDILSDDLGRSFVISSAELSELGWRLVVKQAAT